MASRHACQALKENGRPCRAPALRAGSACFWHAPESREAAAEARRLGGLRAADARGRSGAPTPWRGSARARICSASWSWRWRTPSSWRTPSRARGPWPAWWPSRPGSRRPASGRRACGRWRSASGGRPPMRDRERRLHTVAARLTVPQRVAALLAADPDIAPLPDDIGRGLTPATRAAFHRAAERIDRLHATTRDGLAQVESGITLLGELAERHRTTALCALLATDLEDRLEPCSPRRGLEGAADRSLGRAVRLAVRLLRREVETARGAGGGPAPHRRPPCAPSAAGAGDRGRRVRRGVRRRSAPSRPPRPRGPLPGGPRAAH